MSDASTLEARRRQLASLGGDDGIVVGLAIDHRDSLRALMPGPAGIHGDDSLRDVKRRILAAIAPMASAVMLDEELGGTALDEHALPDSVGLIMPLEAQGYEAVGEGRVSRLLEDFGPADAVERGAVACKVLLPYRADDASAPAQRALLRTAAELTRAAGLALVAEPIPYRHSSEDAEAFAAAWPSLVMTAVEHLGDVGVDLWKLPFPALAGPPEATADACRALHAACDGDPWVLLGAGVDLDLFIAQIAVAGRAGACGFLAGRGIWGPAALAAASGVSGTQLDDVIAVQAVPAFARCRAAAIATARPILPPFAG